jgi:ssDNA thymidine ADP-ribosyltransferase, DarT
MNARVTEFQCIMPLENIPSVLKLGILSNERSAKIEHCSMAMEDVQEKREQKHVPGGLKLHQYANLYFHARNPMLYKRKTEINNLCVLRISTEILQLPGVVLADCNASSPYVRFLAPSQWALLDFEAIYAMDWNRQHANDPYAYRVHKARKCAEVLVPHVVETKFVIGAYVVDEAAKAKLQSLGFDRAVTIDSEMFFR